jgi:hypothetical protein
MALEKGAPMIKICVFIQKGPQGAQHDHPSAESRTVGYQGSYRTLEQRVLREASVYYS